MHFQYHLEKDIEKVIQKFKINEFIEKQMSVFKNALKKYGLIHWEDDSQLSSYKTLLFLLICQEILKYQNLDGQWNEFVPLLENHILEILKKYDYINQDLECLIILVGLILKKHAAFATILLQLSMEKEKTAYDTMEINWNKFTDSQKILSSSIFIFQNHDALMNLLTIVPAIKEALHYTLKEELMWGFYFYPFNMGKKRLKNISIRYDPLFMNEYVALFIRNWNETAELSKTKPVNFDLMYKEWTFDFGGALLKPEVVSLLSEEQQRELKALHPIKVIRIFHQGVSIGLTLSNVGQPSDTDHTEISEMTLNDLLKISDVRAGWGSWPTSPP